MFIAVLDSLLCCNRFKEEEDEEEEIEEEGEEGEEGHWWKGCEGRSHRGGRWRLKEPR